MADISRWDNRYLSGDTPWDTHRPSTELLRVIAEEPIKPCRAIELGCGTGTNAVWLARQGFDVTAVDLSPVAVARAEEIATAERVGIRFLAADVLSLPDLGRPFEFFFDRGCYHVVRRDSVNAFLQTLRRITAPGGIGLVLTGNAREPHEPGPPVVSEVEIRKELGRFFDVLWLREFRFDQIEEGGMQFLAWSCLLKRSPD